MRRLPKPPSPWRLLKNRTLPLLLALVGLIALHPLFTLGGELTANLFPFAIVAVPLVGLASIGSFMRALPLLGILLVIVGWCWIGYRFNIDGVTRSNIPYLVIAYYAYAIIALAHQLLRKAALQDDRLYGGLAIYLLIALMFTSVHRHISVSIPNAYIETTDGTTVPFHWNDALYFSFSTITTLGFGDIVPRAPWARTATILEVVLGVFITVGFIAQLVAASVRLTLGGNDAPQDPPRH